MKIRKYPSQNQKKKKKKKNYKWHNRMEVAMEGTSLLFASSLDSHSDMQPASTNCEENIPQPVAETTSTCDDDGM